MVFAAWALVLGAIAGPEAIRQRYNTSIWVIVASYVLAAPFAGLIVGVLFPLIKRPAGAAFVGVIAAVPVFIGVRVASDGFGEWSGGDFVEILYCSVFVGGGGALYNWYKTNRAKR